MKKIFYVISGLTFLLALIISAVNYSYISLFWFFEENNGSPSTAFMSLFVLGFVSGIFFVLGFKSNKEVSDTSGF
ncbi:hypothetical protein CSB37_03925 [bacterium DOLZORAL124_38_8]|nr:MAG: hypothetical protein CSB37_03925 [bacterium DOLZORAL124_38_8]